MVACPLQMLQIFTFYEMSNVWATVSTIVNLPRMSPHMDFLFEKRMDWTSLHGTHLYHIYILYSG